MNPSWSWLIVALVGVAVVVAAACLAYLVKLRRSFNREGSFMASYRATPADGWVEGFCQYGNATLSWYKLVSLKMTPHKTWTRSGMQFDRATKRVDNDGTVWLDVSVKADGHRFYLFMAETDFTGLLAWVEAAPPITGETGMYTLD
ncbi:MAG: DUF2550 family protein [Actinomycetaceae bacterium]|nr:DUF2550 family protein [Actinomycetaceae bacterium]MDU0970457.1 DUF2550 family protein [Actinomycetaceae bacterium]